MFLVVLSVRWIAAHGTPIPVWLCGAIRVFYFDLCINCFLARWFFVRVFCWWCCKRETYTHTECRQSAYVSGCVCVFWSFSSLSSVYAHVIDCVYGTNFSYLIYMHAVVVPMQTRTLKTTYSKLFAKHIHTPYKDTNDSWTKWKKIVDQIGYGVCDRIRHARLLFQLFDTSSEVFSNSIFGRTVEKHTAHALHLEFRAFRIGRFKGSICARARASVQKFNRCSANEKCFLLFVVPPSNADFTTNAEHV